MTNFDLMDSKQAKIWNNISHELSVAGYSLILLTINWHNDLECEFMQLPYGLKEFNELNLPSQEVSLPRINLVESEEYWVPDYDRNIAKKGAVACETFFREVLNIMQPDCVGIYNTLLPHSRIFQLVCAEIEIPNFSFERGLLPGTFLIDALRNNIDGEINRSFSINSMIQNYPLNPTLLDSYRQWYQVTKPTKYQQAAGNGINRLHSIQNNGRKTVLILGQLFGAGIYPRSSNMCRRVFPGFDSYEEALELIAQIGEEHNLLFRDHPLNVTTNKKVKLPENIEIIQDGNLIDIINMVDFVVILGASTSAFEALIQKKPVLVLGSTMLDIFSPFYQSFNKDIKPEFQKMVTQGWDGISENAERALSYILEHYLVAHNSDVPCSHGINEFAQYVKRLGGHYQHTVSFYDRFIQLGHWVKTL